jgi:hypothetical protein
MSISDNIERCWVDLGADPTFIPEGFEVVKHLRGGFVEWHPNKSKIRLYITHGQASGTLVGEKVLAELSAYDGIPVNANALDYFLENAENRPWVIPEEWKSVEHYKSKHILFWGTIYRFEGALCVRSLNWSEDIREQHWKPGYCWLDSILNSQFPAAMLPTASLKDQSR